MAFLETIALKALTTCSSKIIGNASVRGWNKLENIFKVALSQTKLKEFCCSCEEYVHIRTLYSGDTDVFIDKVYVPLFVSPVDNHKHKIEVLDVNFHSEGIINIQGVAGQGKSTFMRKMLLNTIKLSEQIPIFFELKYFKDDSFLKQLHDWVLRHELKLTIPAIEHLFKTNKVKLLLDGFDEIDPALQEIAARRIKEFSKAYPKVTIIISSRPYTPITKEPSITNYKINDFERDDIEKLFLMISNSDIERTEEAIGQLDKYPRIKKVVNTPILSILLFMTYRSWSKVPDNLSDFYKKIFITLLTHHDSIKPGKKIDRGINIPLNDFQIEDVFSVFCFLTYSNNQVSMCLRDASYYMGKALSYYGFEEELSESLLKIVIQNTGILCKDGFDALTFCHKSLQEYYCAYSISKEDDDNRILFYKKMQTSDEVIEYRDVLAFLSGLDVKFYSKYYYIPCFQKLFKVRDVKESLYEMDLNKGFIELYKAMNFQSEKISESDKKIEDVNITLDLKVEERYSKVFFLNFAKLAAYALYGGVFNESKSFKKLVNKTKSENTISIYQLLEGLDNKQKKEVDKMLKSAYLRDLEEQHKELVKVNSSKRESLLKTIFIDSKSNNKKHPESNIIL